MEKDTSSIKKGVELPNDHATQRPRKERKQNADMRRSQLLEATRRSIVAHGLSKTTLATVAQEAGLSQGVAVFYFKSKTGLLTEVLRDQYERYEQNWQDMLAAAGPDPLDQIVALLKADFALKVSSADNLALWFAFWGAQKFTPQYASVSASFDQVRRAKLEQVCAALVQDAEGLDARELADWIETLTDGYWQRLHLFPEQGSRETAVSTALCLLARLLPRHAERILAK